jgi:hypothetical protein
VVRLACTYSCSSCGVKLCFPTANLGRNPAGLQRVASACSLAKMQVYHVLDMMVPRLLLQHDVWCHSMVPYPLLCCVFVQLCRQSFKDRLSLYLPAVGNVVHTCVIMS